MGGVERVFLSSILERGRTHPTAKISVKDFNKIRKSVNGKLKKHFRGDNVDMARCLVMISSDNSEECCLQEIISSAQIFN